MESGQSGQGGRNVLQHAVEDCPTPNEIATLPLLHMVVTVALAGALEFECVT